MVVKPVAVTPREMPTPSRTPIAPPSTLITTASIRNWRRMSPRLAPIALRMPISRVRSVTDTSMMFMMPMPPTSSDTAAMLASSTVITFEVSSAELAISCCVKMKKS